MRKIVMVGVLNFLILLGCQGPEGPAGPEGRQGPIGLTGPVGPRGPSAPARVNLTIRISSQGDAVQLLPPEVGEDPSRPPSMTCWIAETNTSGTWLPVSDGFTAVSSNRTVCGLVLDAGRWNAVLLNGPPNWFVSFVITY